MNGEGAANGGGGGAAGGAGGVSINAALFWSRLSSLVHSWQSGVKAWAGAGVGADASAGVVDALLVATGSADSDDGYSRLSAIQLWLFGYEIPDSVMLITRGGGGGGAGQEEGKSGSDAGVSVTLLSSAKKCRILAPLGSDPTRPSRMSLTLLESNKADRNASNIDQLTAAIAASNTGKRVGHLPSKTAPPSSSLSATLLQRLSDASVEVVDVSVAISLCLSVHDAAARRSLALAAELTSRVMKKFAVQEMETIVDEEKQQSQLELADRVEDAIRNPTKVGIHTLGIMTGGGPSDEVKVALDDVDSCYTPIIQSGGEGEGSEYDLRVSAQSSSLPLQYSSETAIIMQMGARYRNWCSNIARTYFINPSQQQKDVYLLLIQIYITCLQQIKPGNKIANIMLNARRVISQSKHADLLNNFTKNCGFGIGLEFRDVHLLLTDKNPRLIQPHMVFNLAIGFTDLVTTGTNRKYAVYLADTVVVKDSAAAAAGEGPAKTCEALTKMPREWKDVSYLTGKEGEDDEGGEGAGGDEEFVSGARATRGSAAQEKKEATGATAAEKVRAEHQAELARRQREVALKKLAAENAESAFHSGLDDPNGSLQAYASPAEFPSAAKKDRIFVDMAAETLLLPIYDQLVPFHINTVKNVHRQEEGTYTSVRITFITPDAKLSAQQQLSAGTGASSSSPSSTSPSASHLLRYISELTYRTASSTLDKVFYDIKELKKRVQNRLKEFEARSSLVAQADLVLDKRGPVPTLKEVQARPQLSRKKTTGSLMAHVNGLRYSTTDKFKVDILYTNIKSAFYQPAEGTHQVLLHFELKNPILLDRTKTKKTNFLQIYYEVVDVSEDLHSSNRYRDEDGLMEEQQERLRRRKWNEKFLAFVKEVETKVKDAPGHAGRIEFDIPYRELAFIGVPAKSAVDIMPTVHSLVALDDSPPLVLPLSEVEIAVFERVQFGLRNFDLVFVYRDFSRLPMRIDSIPMKYLEPIKHWLNSCDIVYYESNQNLLWKAVMKHINSDIEEFWKTGGWSFLAENEDDDAGAGGEDGEEGGTGGGGPAEESESEFELDSGEEAEDDSEEYETPSEEEDEDDDEEGSEEDSEEGEDWDELESKAKKQDKEKRAKAMEKGERDFSDEDDDDADRDQRPKKQTKPAQPPPGKQAAPKAPMKSAAARPPPGKAPVANPFGNKAAKPAGTAAAGAVGRR